LTVKFFGTIIDKYKIMKNTLKYFWPVILTVAVYFEIVLFTCDRLKDIGMQLVVGSALVLLFFMLHKLKNVN